MSSYQARLSQLVLPMILDLWFYLKAHILGSHHMGQKEFTRILITSLALIETETTGGGLERIAGLTLIGLPKE